MNDLLLHQLGRALYSLECEGDKLDDLLFPRQACSGTNAGKPPARRGSTPPVNLAMLDLKLSTENVVAWWAMRVPHAMEDGPASRNIADGARWLQGHLAAIDDAPWGELAAQEIIAAARLVSEVVSDPIDDELVPVESGTCRAVAAWARAAGAQVSKTTINRWAKAGEIPSSVDDCGRVIVSLADVLTRIQTTNGTQSVAAGHRVV